ncbi:hypothetical protein [Eudoraea sp.]|uniref:hypothetical protein n=1 Tax=Eudoraea sp. TaxID=1979955 RepID=UPI003C753F99
MKTASQILMLMAVISFMSCGQLHVVTLYVDTSQVEKSNTDQYAHFGQPKGISNKDFTIYVRKGDRVIWNAVSTSNSADVVNITSIINKSGVDKQNKPFVNFFKAKYSNPDYTMSQSSTRDIKGIVRRAIKKGKPGDIQKYSLTFTINDMKKEIEVDPKMQMFY